MAKIGILFKKGYIIEADDEIKAIKEASAKLKMDLANIFGDDKRAVDELFKLEVVASEIVEGEKLTARELESGTQ